MLAKSISVLLEIGLVELIAEYLVFCFRRADADAVAAVEMPQECTLLHGGCDIRQNQCAQQFVRRSVAIAIGSALGSQTASRGQASQAICRTTAIEFSGKAVKYLSHLAGVRRLWSFL